jgi:hypothetical protein
MATSEATAVDLIEHAHNAIQDADRWLDAGNGREASLRLLDASALLRLAAECCDPGARG